MIKLWIQKVWHVYDLIFVDCVCEITWRRKNADFFQNMQQQQKKTEYISSGLIVRSDWTDRLTMWSQFQAFSFPFR